MVDPVSNALGRLRPARDAAESPAHLKSSSLTPPAGNSAAGSDTVNLSAQAQSLPDELKSGPPMDLEIVKKIKDAIAEGKYPIDLQAITESLFQNFRELVN